MQCITFSTTDDSILEEDEVFDFSVTTNDPAVSRVLPDSGLITIQDSDRESATAQLHYHNGGLYALH